MIQLTAFLLWLIIFETVSTLKLPEAFTNPRYCGNKDDSLIRDKRFSIFHGGHANQTVYYRISDYSVNLTHAEVDDVLARAFNVWSEYTELKFIQKEPGEPVDIDIRFAVRAHGDCGAFDGRGGVLAHAKKHFVHFDDEEKFKATNNGQGTSLFKVAVHEIGHSLGLHHSAERGAIMFWQHLGDEEDQFQLHDDDILGIEEVYGEKVIRPVFDLDLCKDPTFDTMFDTPDGKTYIFKKDKYFEIQGSVIVDGPKAISDKWVGLPESINGAFTQNGKTFFFKDSEYWRFVGDQMDNGYPDRLDRWYSEIPDRISDATVWKDGKVYFFRGSQVYRMDEFNEQYTNVTRKFIIDEWKGIPNHTDAVHYSTLFRAALFFKIDNFYVYGEAEHSPAPYQIRTSSYFFSCNHPN